jgi:hypothetical protein
MALRQAHRCEWLRQRERNLEKSWIPAFAGMTNAMKIAITWDKQKLEAELQDTPTSRALLAALSLESRAHTWGDEVYFEIPIKTALEPDAREVVDPGTICFWVQGSALAIPFGPTPVSKGDECRLVTRVNVLGRILGDAKTLKSVRNGTRMRVELAIPTSK